jgi:hypothetical protein
MNLERIEPLRSCVNEVVVDRHSRLAAFYSRVTLNFNIFVFYDINKRHLQGGNTNT